MPPNLACRYVPTFFAHEIISRSSPDFKARGPPNCRLKFDCYRHLPVTPICMHLFTPKFYNYGTYKDCTNLDNLYGNVAYFVAF